MMDVKLWTATLASWAGVSFVLCIAWCSVAPDGWHARAFLEMALPGFTWLSPGSFLIGLIDSIAVGAYSGALVAALHNQLSRRIAHAAVPGAVVA